MAKTKLDKKAKEFKNTLTKYWDDVSEKAESAFGTLLDFLKKHKKMIISVLTLYIIYQFLFEDKDEENEE